MALTERDGRWFDFFKRRGVTYKLAANQPAFQDMLIDLAVFCRANETCIVKDAQGKVDKDQTLILEGRREVWLRIQNHTKLNAQQLFSLYTGRQFNPGEE